MDTKQLIARTEDVLSRVSEEYERLTDATEDGVVWGLELDEDTTGFISMETNEVLDRLMVSVSLSLGSTQDLSREDLLSVLLVNRDLPGACLTVTPPFEDSPEQFLLLNKMLAAGDFEPDMIPEYFNHLRDLVDRFFSQ
jgi:hypothetical protein